MKTDKVKKIYKNIHTKLINEISLLDDSIKLNNTKWRHIDSGGGISCKINGSKYIEKAAINFSSIRGNKLPESALEKSGVQEIRKYNATGVSVIIHPLNPKTACSHLNIRFFEAKHKGGNVWWFGGGFDLTPYFITNGDMLYWKNEARKLCDKYDKSFYNKFNSHCNDYFYLPHRNEPRGIGGIFYDQLNKNDFEFCSSFSLDTANTFIQAYSNLFNKRKDQKFSKKQREFQLYRRGRYVEFNLLHDRGTLFGLQSGGRVESILMSMPPLVSWNKINKEFDQYEKSLNKVFNSARK